MTKHSKKIISLAISFAIFCTLFSPLSAYTTAKIKKPKLSTNKISLYVGATKKLTIKRAPGSKISWRIKNKKTATVKKSGKFVLKVTGKKAGKTSLLVTVRKKGRKYKLACSVTVRKRKAAVPIISPSVSATSLPANAPNNNVTFPAASQPTGVVPSSERPATTTPTSSAPALISPTPATSTASPVTGPTTTPGTSTASPVTNPSTTPATSTASPVTGPTTTPATSTASPINSPSVSPSIQATATPIASPTGTPKPNISLPLSAESVMDTYNTNGSPVYNSDGSITVSLKKGYGGIALYLDESKQSVTMSDYSKIIIETSADVASQLCINYFTNGSSYNSAVSLFGYPNVKTTKTTISYPLSSYSNKMNGIRINYNTYNQTNPADPLELTIYSITLVADQRDITDATTNYSSLANLADNYGFKLGTVINDTKVGDVKYRDLMKYHFNSLTAANEMKAYSLLDQTASKQNAANGNDIPAVDFTKADKIMDFAKANGIQVRGHALVWDADMKDWFFRVGFDSSNDYASTEVVKARMKSYIEQVLTHFEEEYPGVIYCWDVVNEAVADDASEYKSGDNRHLRTARGTNTNLFYDHVGDDYVELAFQYARETLDNMDTVPDIELYYNDFNTFYSDKRDAICELVKSINNYKSDGNGGFVKLCDGVGMQSYLGGYGEQNNCMNEDLITMVETAINKYADLGMHVQATELAVRNYLGDETTLQQHGAFYKKLFEVYTKINTERTDKPLKAVAIWGIVDNPDMDTSDYGYKMNGPYCGLFDEYLTVKPAFKNIYELMGGE